MLFWSKIMKCKTQNNQTIPKLLNCDQEQTFRRFTGTEKCSIQQGITTSGIQSKITRQTNSRKI